MNDAHVAFEVCFDNNLGPPINAYGIQLFYATDPFTIQEVNWAEDSSTWTIGLPFAANGHGGLGCYTWGPDTVQYIMYIDLDNNVKMMWKDVDRTAASTPTHPTNQWVNSTLEIPGVYPQSAIGYNNNIVVQKPDLSLAGYNISFDSENSKLTGQQFTFDQKPIPATHLWLWNLPTNSGDSQLSMFDQKNGTDVTLTVRDQVTGQVLTLAMPIPTD
jgi:hypothetical protein